MIVKNTIFIDTTDSTNLEAWRRIKEGNFAEGTVIWTSHQKAGKGAGSNKWESEEKMNLAASYILKPDFIDADQQFYLNKCVSLAVRDCISELCKNKFEVYIKWPNDIIIANKKIAGILIENAIIGNTYSTAVCGIGVNINQEKFPPHLSNAISLKNITGKTRSLKICLETLSDYVLLWYKRLQLSDFETIDKTYLEYLYLKNVASKFKTENKSFTGKIIGVSAYGNLLVETIPGEISEFGFKEIVFPI